MKYIGMLGMVLIALSSMWAHAADYESVKPMLLEAIDAPDGTAHGVIGGPVARKFNATTGSSGAVVADVSTIKSFSQEGCKRLKLRLRQSDVPAREGNRGVFGISYTFNLCRDGSPPIEDESESRN